MSASVYAVATLDTKGAELAYAAGLCRSAGVRVLTVDIGTGGPPAVAADISREKVAGCHPRGAQYVLDLKDRGEAVAAMGDALQGFLLQESYAGRLAGVLGLGGGGGTALITQAMRGLPIGLPKLMVSTMASGNVAPYVGTSDIALLYSVVDIAGLNAVSTRVLANAAHAMAGMVLHKAPPAPVKPALGMTMFGVTTPCVTEVRRLLEEDGFDCLVFHATGSGGRAMEKLVASGMIEGVIDVTTTEIADEVVGGILSAGPERLDAVLHQGVPYVLSLGALDMVNFGARNTVPASFARRNFYIHNPQVTLMRTKPEENREFARWIAAKLQRARAPVVVVIPEGGVSAIDAPGEAFHDPEADEALFSELERATRGNSHVTIKRYPEHINDPKFAKRLVDKFCHLWARRLRVPLP